MKLWEADSRRYKYIARISADGKHWIFITDHSSSPSAGWQKLDFPARPVRFIEINGLHNSWNNGFHLVEIEAYCALK